MKNSSIADRILLAAALLFAFAFPATGIAAPEAAPLVIALSAEASQPAANDLIRATVVAEATGTSPDALAQRINAQIAEGLNTAKRYQTVKTRSGNTGTYPTYGKSNRIEGWHMRSELLIESKSIGAVSELLGQLQSTLNVANLQQTPSPETKKSAENAAIVKAIEAFRVRAQIVAEALGKNYRIRELSVSTGSHNPGPRLYQKAMFSASTDAAPMPIEAGESLITATVEGKIEVN